MQIDKLHIDVETRSRCDLRKVGLWNYVHDPSTMLWCMAWAINDAEPELWLPGEPLPEAIRLHIVHEERVYAHNAQFELMVWNKVCVPAFGWPTLRPEQTHCTMAMAYAMGLPGSLEDASLAAGLHINKDTLGRALMLKYASPWKVTESGVRWMNENPKFRVDKQDFTGKTGLLRLHEYCKQDVRVERALEKRLVPLSNTERQIWLMDQEINVRGMPVDVESVKAAEHVIATVQEHYAGLIADVTDGAVAAVTATGPLREWLATQGVLTDSVAKDAVIAMLATPGLPEKARLALTYRQEAAKSSTAKLAKILDVIGEDGLIRFILQYHGANTGRWAGRIVQPHNFPRDVPSRKDVDKILDLIRRGEWEAVDMIYGPPLTMISKCIRGFFLAPAGHRIVTGDFASVESRGGAWFAGEDWKIKAFEAADAGTGPGIYELAYSQMFNVSIDSVRNPSPERQIGKVSELAFEYGGGIGAFHSMAANYNVHVSDADANDFKRRWRAKHPAHVQTWYDLESAAIAAVGNPGDTFEAGAPGRQVKYKMVGSFLWCLLPSGRALCYPYPKLLPGKYDNMQLTYMKAGINQTGKRIDDPHNTNNWARVTTWGGTLLENVVQALCRDLLADCLLRMWRARLDIWLHVHDEACILTEIDSAEADRQIMQEIMCTPPAWAAGFPLIAECEIMERYGK